jgi:hypothetical protein
MLGQRKPHDSARPLKQAPATEVWPVAALPAGQRGAKRLKQRMTHPKRCNYNSMPERRSLSVQLRGKRKRRKRNVTTALQIPFWSEG